MKPGRPIWLASVVGLCLLAATPTRAVQPACRIAAGVSRLQGLPEASGLALSRRTAGVLWSLNDSDEPVVVVLSAAGAVQGRVRVTGAAVEDWEAIATGSCPQGNCLYIADIGDNSASRSAITIYRTREPAPGDARTETAEALHATYPDGPQDAEALLVLPSGQLFVVTKGATGPIALYRVASSFRSGASAPLERVRVLVPAKGKGTTSGADRNGHVTDANVSPDGRWIVLRTADAVLFYDAREFAGGTIREVFRYDVSSLREPQGEGVALSAKGEVWLAGEGGKNSLAGTFARLTCTLP